jgi:acyl-CoA synthetase (AMP-forming)/AMP-acid ligase II
MTTGRSETAAEARTLTEALLIQGESRPDFRWLTLLDSSEKEHPLTFGGLLENGRKTAHSLEEYGVKAGDPVILILPTSLEFLYVYWGILLLGAIPVPLYPPVRINELDRYSSQLQAIVKNSCAQIIVTFPVMRRMFRWAVRPSERSVSIVDAEALLTTGMGGRKDEPGSSHHTALIQYTSGSTGKPKGVELTHENLLSHIRSVARTLDYSPEDVGVSWLPLYHDMGLIGAILSTLVYAIPLVLLSPVDFIKSPRRWLRAVHRYRGTLSAAPNFAYSLCTRKVRDRDIEEMDLSSWRVAINGAELIHHRTLVEFADRFAAAGFSRKAFMPAYGLAEATLAVSFTPVDEAPVIRSYARKTFELEGRAVPVPDSDPEAVRWVSVGRPIPDHLVKIVNSFDTAVPDRLVGEVTVQGPSVMKGYYLQPDITSDVLRGGWLYTGDLGFVDEGQLFITGRIKDLIVRGGKNVYPHDIEESVSSVAGVRPGCVSAFGIPHIEQGTEEIIVVAETRIRSSARTGRMVQEIRKKVKEDTGCSPDRVILVPPGTVAKTSSGKIQRYLCRERYLGGEFSRPRRGGVWKRIGFWLRFLTAFNSK